MHLKLTEAICGFTIRDNRTQTTTFWCNSQKKIDKKITAGPSQLLFKSLHSRKVYIATLKWPVLPFDSFKIHIQVNMNYWKGKHKVNPDSAYCLPLPSTISHLFGSKIIPKNQEKPNVNPDSAYGLPLPSRVSHYMKTCFLYRKMKTQ